MEPVLKATIIVSRVRECKLISGVAALSAQIVLLSVVITVLLIKRHKERPRRAWNIWSLDISKQAFSGCAGHTCGMAIAILAHHHSGASSQCGWYLVVYGLDATLGITVAICLHRAANSLARHYHFVRQRQLYTSGGSKSSEDHQGGGSDGGASGGPASEEEDWGSAGTSGTCGRDAHGDTHPWWRALVEIGNYGDPPSLRKWVIQVGLWVTCVVSARFVVGLAVMSCIPYFRAFTQALEARFAGHPDLLLFFVMVGVPMLLNVAQAWVQDQFLKWKHKGARFVRRLNEAEDDTGKPGPGEASTLQILTLTQQRVRTNEE